jgi:hypothetical protein
MKFKYKKEITFIIILIAIGQAVFGLVSGKFTVPRYENSIYATIGITPDKSDLQKLNEAAHYFGQTIIGWTKFPNFMKNLSESVKLPERSSLNAHMQERQNIIFTVTTPEPISAEKLLYVKDYIQGRLNEYNSTNRTQFFLSSLDYGQTEIKRSYAYGAGIALIVSIVAGLACLFIKNELLI